MLLCTTNTIVNCSRKERFSNKNLIVMDNDTNDTVSYLILNDITVPAFHERDYN